MAHARTVGVKDGDARALVRTGIPHTLTVTDDGSEAALDLDTLQQSRQGLQP